MISLLKNTIFYVIGYLLLMIPTYVLPYFGSNSLVVNGLATALGRGPMPQWWLHAWVLVMLVLLGHLRGKLVGKRYLIVFPLLAAVFDMVPGLSVIPMVPTVMHALAIIVGVINPAVGNAAVEGDDAPPAPSSRGSAIVAGLMTVATVVGSAWFAFNIAGSGPSKNQISTSKPPPISGPSKSATVPAPMTVQISPVPVTTVQPGVQASATASDSPMTEKRTAVKPVHSKPMPQVSTAHRPAKSEPASAPNVRYINLND